MTKSDLINGVIAISAIIAVTFLEYAALASHTDGVNLSIVIAVIAGLGGYHVSSVVAPFKQQNDNASGS